MSPRKRAASPAATAAAGNADDNDPNAAAPSPAAAAKKRRAASKSASASPAPAAAKAPRKSPAKKRDENKAPAGGDEEPAAKKEKKPPAAAAAIAKEDEGGGPDAAEAAAEASFLGPPPVPFSKSKGVVPYDASSMRPPQYEGPNAWRVISWNVAGLRSLITKHPGALAAVAARERADALCLQETKLQASDAERLMGPATGSSKDLGETLGLPGWRAAAWSCSGGNGTKKGYAGVTLLVKGDTAKVAWAQVGLGGASAKHDDEGRTVAARLEDRSGASRPPLTVVGVYVPNSGEGLKRLQYRINEWDPALVAFVGGLMKGESGGGGGGAAGGGGGDGGGENERPLVVVAGDLNVAHREEDIHSPKTNTKSAGFTPEERASFSSGLIGGSALAAGQGGGGGGGGGDKKGGLPLVDSFRARHPNAVGYTYYSYRSRARTSGKGWRLDYCLVPEWCVRAEEAGAGGGGGGGGGGGAKGQQQPRLYDAYILADVSASDHVPLGVVVKT